MSKPQKSCLDLKRWGKHKKQAFGFEVLKKNPDWKTAADGHRRGSGESARSVESTKSRTMVKNKQIHTNKQLTHERINRQIF